MADRTGLGIVGLIFGGVTAAVVLIGGMVVAGHLDGRLVLDTQRAPMAAMSSLAVTAQ